MIREKTRKGPTSKVVYSCRGCKYLYTWCNKNKCSKNGWEDDKVLNIKSSLNTPIECFYMLSLRRKLKLQKINEELNIDYSKILNIYPYGSQIYLNADEYSDSDHIIVFKSSLLPSGAFKDNAISSRFKDIQGVCYSRSGFIDAINNYDITALECIFLPEDKIIQKKMNFGITKYNEKELAKKNYH